MKNNEIVKALREHAEWAQANEWEAPITLSDDLAEAADLIEKLTDRCAHYAEEIAVAQERSRWIPVEERLPEISNSWGVSDIVLCIISDPSGCPPPNPGLCVYLDDGRWTCHGQIVRVTHWMPLPAGPEEE